MISAIDTIFQAVIANSDMDNFKEHICKVLAQIHAYENEVTCHLDQYIQFLEFHEKRWPAEAAKRRPDNEAPCYTGDPHHPFAAVLLYVLLPSFQEQLAKLGSQADALAASRHPGLQAVITNIQALAASIDEA